MKRGQSSKLIALLYGQCLEHIPLMNKTLIPSLVSVANEFGHLCIVNEFNTNIYKTNSLTIITLSVMFGPTFCIQSIHAIIAAHAPPTSLPIEALKTSLCLSLI